MLKTICNRKAILKNDASLTSKYYSLAEGSLSKLLLQTGVLGASLWMRDKERGSYDATHNCFQHE